MLGQPWSLRHGTVRKRDPVHALREAARERRCRDRRGSEQRPAPAFKQFDLRVTKASASAGWGSPPISTPGTCSTSPMCSGSSRSPGRPSTPPSARPVAGRQRLVRRGRQASRRTGRRRHRPAVRGRLASGCAPWMTAGGRAAAPNCVYLIRAEERFGDGDHLFTARRATARLRRLLCLRAGAPQLHWRPSPAAAGRGGDVLMRGEPLLWRWCALLAAPGWRPAAAPARTSARRPAGFRLLARAWRAHVNRVFCGLFRVARSARTLHRPVPGGRRRVLAQGHGEPVRLQLRAPGGRDHRRDQTDNPWAGDTTGAFFFDPWLRGERRTDPAALQRDQPRRLGQLAGRGIGARSADRGRQPVRPDRSGADGGVAGRRLVAHLGREPLARRAAPIRSASCSSSAGWPGTGRAATRTSSTSSSRSTTSPRPAGGLRGRTPRHARDPAPEGPGVPANNARSASRSRRGIRSTTFTSPSPRTWTWRDAAQNYTSVNVPFALGYTYQNDFPQLDPGSSTRRFSPPSSPASDSSG